MTQLIDIDSIPHIIDEMTLEEKSRLVTGYLSFSTYPLERFGIPSMRLLDGGTGINLNQYYEDLGQRLDKHNEKNCDVRYQLNSFQLMNLLNGYYEPYDKETLDIFQCLQAEIQKTIPDRKQLGCFPPGILLGSTWDRETVYQCGNAVAKEADVYQVDVLLGSPNVNIHRDPLNGRLFEGYSEDPCLVSELAPNFVKGVQEEGIAANVKHFAANNQETHRQNINEIIPIRALHEIYLPGFKSCVTNGQVKTIMSAYNKINGKACSMNHWLLTEILKEDWGFEGMVVSDWGAVYNQQEALKAGNDLDMPGEKAFQPILEAIENGSLSQVALDTAVSNILKMLLQLPVMKGRKNKEIDQNHSRQTAYKAATEGIILLKNDDVLPLNTACKVSLLGEKSKRFIESGSGSAYVYTDQYTSLLDETIKIIGNNNVTYGQITDAAEFVIITVSANGKEGSDRIVMDLEQEDKSMLLRSLKEAKQKNKKTIVILNIAGPVDVREYIDNVDALICTFFPWMEGGRACADILFGKINPSGKLPLTFPKRYQDCPTSINFPGSGGEVHYGEGIFVGYRYYEMKDLEPMYPFGFGLSYSEFEITDSKCDVPEINMDHDEKVRITVKVKNTSSVPGKEVVQLYIKDPVSTLVKPLKELKAFQKVSVEPGEEKTLVFEIGKEHLASYDNHFNQWVSEAGIYEVLIGNASNHITTQCSFVAKGNTVYNFGKNSKLNTVLQHPKAYQHLINFLKKENIDLSNVEKYQFYFPDIELADLFNELFQNSTNREDSIHELYHNLYQVDRSIE
jgi:Beta-glucosidase-related glycosidases